MTHPNFTLKVTLHGTTSSGNIKTKKFEVK